jgi:hypothetical protein
MDAVDFAEGHQEQMMIPKPNYLRESIAIVIGGFNAANFADGGRGAFRFDDQADQLNDAPARFSDARGAHAFER